jgi:hypothetical protein
LSRGNVRFFILLWRIPFLMKIEIIQTVFVWMVLAFRILADSTFFLTSSVVTVEKVRKVVPWWGNFAGRSFRILHNQQERGWAVCVKSVAKALAGMSGM